MCLGLNMDSSAKIDLDFYLPDFSISFPEIQKYYPDRNTPHARARIESVEEIEDMNVQNKGKLLLQKSQKTC